MLRLISALRDRLRNHAPSLLVIVKTLVAAVALAVLITALDTVYANNEHRVPLLLAVIIATLLTLSLRALGLRAEWSWPIHLVAYILAAAYLVHSDELQSGLPGVDALGAVWDGTTRGWSDLLSTPVPLEATGSFLAAPFLVLWLGAVIVTVASTARRLTATVVPAVAAAWFALLLLGPGESTPLGTVAIVVGAMLVYLVVDAVTRATQPIDDAGFTVDEGLRQVATDGRRRAIRTAMIQGLPVVAIVLGLGMLVGARASIVEDVSRYDPRSGWVPTVEITETVSPLSRVRSQLIETEDSASRLFSVTIDRSLDEPLLIRTAALDDFDGALWRTQTDFAQIGSILPATYGENVGETASLTIELTPAGIAEVGPFVPVVGRPTAIRGVTVAYNDEGETLVATDRSGSASETYELEVLIPPMLDDPDVNDAEASTAAESQVTLPDDDLIPAEIMDSLREFAGEATAEVGDDPSDVETLRAFKRAFEGESFGYDLERTQGHSLAAIGRYIGPAGVGEGLGQNRKGFSEQVASTSTMLARLNNVPARVAVGYRVETGEVTEAGAGPIEVFPRHAHAWTEVLLEGFGWVPMDPEPDRTQVDVEPPEDLVAVDEPFPSEDSIIEGGDDADSDLTSAGGGLRWWVLAAGIVLLLIVTAIPIVKFLRSKRRRNTSDPRHAVLGAWAEVVDGLVDRGLAVAPATTEVEITTSAQAHRLTDEVVALRELAELATSAKWSTQPPDDGEVDDAKMLGRVIVRDIRSRAGWAKRPQLLFSPRSVTGAFGRRRGSLPVELVWDEFGALGTADYVSEANVIDDEIIDLTALERESSDEEEIVLA